MSATSKRDRALRDGLEPVTGKDMMVDMSTTPPVAAPAPEPEEEESDNGEV